MRYKPDLSRRRVPCAASGLAGQRCSAGAAAAAVARPQRGRGAQPGAASAHAGDGAGPPRVLHLRAARPRAAEGGARRSPRTAAYMPAACVGWEACAAAAAGLMPDLGGAQRARGMRRVAAGAGPLRRCCRSCCTARPSRRPWRSRARSRRRRLWRRPQRLLLRRLRREGERSLLVGRRARTSARLESAGVWGRSRAAKAHASHNYVRRQSNKAVATRDAAQLAGARTEQRPAPRVQAAQLRTGSVRFRRSGPGASHSSTSSDGGAVQSAASRIPGALGRLRAAAG
jgi:hypothetical protein